MTFSRTWSIRFFNLAKEVASWSKDPSTQVGAIIVDDNKIVRAMGYNGFPRGVNDSEHRYADRTQKYSFVAHAELNAILNANSSVKDCTLYLWPLAPCSECAKVIIQAGIKSVKYPEIPYNERWKESNEVALKMFRESGVQVGGFVF